MVWSEEWGRDVRSARLAAKQDHDEERPSPRRPLVTTNRLAVASLVCAIIGCLPWGEFALPSLLAIGLGTEARRRIRRSDGLEEGDGLAIAGIAVGAAGLLWLVIVIVFFRPVF